MTDAGEVSFGAEAASGVAAKLVMLGFGLVATAYFARILGPHAFGGFYLLLSVVQFVNRVPSGIGGACQKRLAETDTSNAELLGLTLCTTVASVAVFGALAVVARERLAAYAGLSNAATLAVVLFGAVSLFLPYQFLLAGTGRFGVTQWIDLLRQVAKTTLQFAFVAVGFGVTGMVAGYAAATVLCFPIVVYLLRVRPAIPTLATVSLVWEYARYNVPATLVGKAYTRFDVFLLGWFGLTAAVGYYEVAVSLTGLATLISAVVMDGIVSRTSNLASRNRSIRETVVATVSYTSVLAIPLFVLVVFVGGPLVATVYGSEYADAVPFLVAIAVYRVVQTQREPLDSAVKGMGRPDAAFRISAVTLVVNFALGVPLVFAIGAIGVIVATVVAESVRWLLLHWALRQNDAGVPALPAPLRAQLSGAVAMTGVMAGLSVLVPPAIPGGAIALGTVGTATYLAAILALDAVARRALLERVQGLRSLVTDDERGRRAAR